MADSKPASQELELAKLLNEIQIYNLQEIVFNDIVPESGQLSQPDFLQILKNVKKNICDYIIIDVRSEKEFEKNSIPCSINLPILNNIERHKVGLLYTKHSKKKALSLAYHYAKAKEQDYIKDALRYSEGKGIIVYCWRGGERSKYAVNLLQKNHIKAIRLHGGQKGFRKIVQEFLYNKSIPIVSLSGATGCGKSEILEYIQQNYPEFPSIHLEKCAGHASSVFGEIRYMLRGETPKNQQQFETNIFMEILPHIGKNNDMPVFLSEDESKKIGRLVIPTAVQNGLAKQRHINLTCPIEERIERLAKDYFAFDSKNENTKNKAKTKVAEQLKFLSKKLSREKTEQYMEWIDKNKYSEFLKDIMENYYDKIYKKPVNAPLFVVDNREIDSAVKTILKFWEEKIL